MSLEGGLMVNEKRKARAGIAIAAVTFLAIAAVTGCSPRTDYDAFASCLAEKGLVLAGTEWCHYCAAQKDAFKGAFEEIIIPAGAYKDCDRQQGWCEQAGIEGYPTWVLPDGNLLVGVQKLTTLATVSGCNL